MLSTTGQPQCKMCCWRVQDSIMFFSARCESFCPVPGWGWYSYVQYNGEGISNNNSTWSSIPGQYNLYVIHTSIGQYDLYVMYAYSTIDTWCIHTVRSICDIYIQYNICDIYIHRSVSTIYMWYIDPCFIKPLRWETTLLKRPLKISQIFTTGIVYFQ